MTQYKPGKRKLTPKQVQKIRELRAKAPAQRLPSTHKYSLAAIAKRFGISKTTVSMISTGRSWKRALEA